MWKGEWCTVVVRKADAASRRYHVTFSDDEEDDVTVLTRDKLRAPKSKGPKPQPQPRRTIASAIPDDGDVALPVGASAHPGGPDSAADVIIIGAGIAGLECARVLGAAGVRCTLLEARTRFGGRIHTDHTTFGFPIECGAHWIHGATKRNPLKQLADELGIQRVVTLDEEKLIDEHGTELGSDSVDELEAQMEKLTKTIYRCRKELRGKDCGLDRSLLLALDQLGLQPAMRERLRQYAHSVIATEGCVLLPHVFGSYPCCQRGKRALGGEWNGAWRHCCRHRALASGATLGFASYSNTDSCAMFCRYDLDLMSTLDWDEDEEFGETPEQMFPGGYDQVQR